MKPLEYIFLSLCPNFFSQLELVYKTNIYPPKYCRNRRRIIKLELRKMENVLWYFQRPVLSKVSEKAHKLIAEIFPSWKILCGDRYLMTLEQSVLLINETWKERIRPTKQRGCLRAVGSRVERAIWHFCDWDCLRLLSQGFFLIAN